MNLMNGDDGDDDDDHSCANLLYTKTSSPSYTSSLFVLIMFVINTYKYVFGVH